jgi:FkbM family methyltransferase
MNLSIVYYIFINPDRNWKIIVEGQMKDLQFTNIPYNKIYIHICSEQQYLIDECKNLINEIGIQRIVYSQSSTNQFEYPGLKLLYDLSHNSNEIFLYIHSKGMVYNNHYAIRSVAEQPSFRVTLHYYQKAIEIFRDNKLINKVGIWPSDKGYIWLNFFYIRGGYLKKGPEISDYRYYYEEYIGNGTYTDCYSLALDKIGCYDKNEVMDYICNLKNIPFISTIDTYYSKMLPTFGIFYGTNEYKIDITKIAIECSIINNIVYIPAGDEQRSMLFNVDPVRGVLKNIYIVYQGKETVYPYTTSVYIDINENKFYQIDTLPDHVKKVNSIYEKLMSIQSSLKIDYGNFLDENPEQIMSVLYFKGHEKVLEIGGNIGRNSLIISKLLNNSSNLLTLECDPHFCSQLYHNRNLNSLNFNIENAAISKRPLIQRGWDTMVSEELLEGYKKVNCITYDQLIAKWNINFDTLVIDCEGAFYYILMDFPHILNNINLIITENDYHVLDHKIYIDNILKQNGFYVDYSRPGGWGPCSEFFYQVWKK